MLSNVYTLSFHRFNMFLYTFVYNTPLYTCHLHSEKKYQLNSTGMNFLFTDFVTAKFWLKIFDEYLKKLFKVLPFSKFLYQFVKNNKN